jgi:hypothetical protein
MAALKGFNYAIRARFLGRQNPPGSFLADIRIKGVPFASGLLRWQIQPQGEIFRQMFICFRAFRQRSKSGGKKSTLIL